MDVHQWHSNTPMYANIKHGKFIINFTKVYKIIIPDVGTAGIYDYINAIICMLFKTKILIVLIITVDPEYLKY